MINYARQNADEQTDATPPPADDHIAPRATRICAGLLRNGGDRRRGTVGR